MPESLRPRLVPALLVLLIAVALSGATATARAAKPASAGQAADRLDPDLLAGMRARAIGPAGMSGRVTSVEGVVAHPNVLYAGAASGGVWKSVNGGITWEPIFDDQPVTSIGALAIFQASPDVVWVGTGEGNVRNSTSVGNGVYRTLDGGKTWSHLGLEATERISRIVLHPTDPNVAWVAALGREWGENPERGVFKTEDGGKTWSRVLYVDEKTGAADLAIDPGNPQKLYAALWQYRRWPWELKSGGPGSGLYVSHDGGRSWQRQTPEDGMPKGDLGRIKLAVSRSSPQIVYASVEAAESALLRSEDGGEHWAAVNTKPNVAFRPFYFADLEVDPQWPNRVYDLNFNISVSDDSGKNFDTLPLSNSIHGDYHAIWIDPDDPQHLVVGNDGGLAVSHDRGKTAAFVADLPIAQFYHVAVDMDRPYNVYGGLQDNGSWRGPSTVYEFGGIKNHHWQFVGGGDGFDTQPDPADSMTGYSMSQSGFLSRFNLHTQEAESIRPPEPPGTRLRFNWNAGLALDPFDPGSLYYGSQFLHKSTDRGKSWTIVSPDLTTNNPKWQRADESGGITPDSSGAEGYTTILAIAPSPVQRGVIWVGTDDGRVQVTRDGGTTWTSVEKNVPGVPANTWVPHIRASKFDAGTAFVVFDDHRRSNWTPYVVKTDDYGKTWKSLATPDLRGYALAIEQDPVDPDLLFLGTEFGLWFTLDGGRQWTPWKAGLPTASVMDLVIHPRDHDLVIATHGRALYVIDDLSPLRTLSAAVMAEPLHLFPIADAQQHTNGATAGGFGLGSSDFSGENRAYGALITFAASGPGLPLPDDKRERQRKEDERAAARKAAVDPERAAPEGGKAQKQADQPPAQPGAEAPGAKKEEKKSDEKKGDEPPKAEIRVADAAGKVIRHFKMPVKLGLNRAVWGLQRDSFKLPPPGAGQPPTPEDAPGPEIPPGTYTVTVKLGEHEARQTVRVLPDPRFKNTPEDWQRRWAAVERAGRLQDVAVAAIERLARTKADVEAAVAQEKLAETAKREAEGRPRLDPGNPKEKLPLATAAGELGRKLGALDKRLWSSPDSIGIPPPTDVFTKVGFAAAFVLSTNEPPSPTNLQYLDRAEQALAAFLVDFNRFYAEDVATFRKQVAAARIELLPVAAPLAVGPEGAVTP